MKNSRRNFLGAVAAMIALPCAVAAQPAAKPADCSPQGNVQFICGHASPEDLALIPGTNWMVTSGLNDDGGIRLVNVAEKTMTVFFPAAGVEERLDSKTYDNCPGPLEAEDKAHYFSQGNSLQTGKGGMYTLYSVHRGKRESIEIFNIDPHGKTPVITWIGCVLAPNDWVRLNSVVGLPEGGLAATNFRAREGTPQFEDSRKKMAAGENNGFVWEWHTGKGWTQTPYSAGSGMNGIEVSKDGKWFYLDEYGTHNFFRLSRGVSPVRRDSIPVGFRIDNVKWAPDGMLIAAGASDKGTKVIKIDPETLKVTELLDTDAFKGGSVAVPLNGAYWLGSPGGNRIAIVPAGK